MRHVSWPPLKTLTHSLLGSSFSKSQVTSLLASGVDYGALFLMTEKFHVWYVVATAAGAFLGAVTNFFLNRHWTFQAASGRLNRQALKYCVVSLGSLILNTLGVYLFTEFGKIYYAVSVLITSLVVGIVFNYPLQKRFVYR